MKNQDKAKEPSEEQVAAYLETHPEFFTQHSSMLLNLQLPHPSGRAISLIERQVHTFRERNTDLRNKLNALLENARENDRLFEQSQRLTLALIECDELGDAFDALNYHLDQEFQVEQYAVWVLTAELQSASNQFLADCSFLNALASRLKDNRTAYSGITREEINILFPRQDAVQSAAMCIVRRGSQPIAIVAVGHSDPERYQANGGTLFLRHLSELLSRIFDRFMP